MTRRCFILRRFHPDHENVWELAIKPAVIAAGFEPWDAQEERLGSDIIHSDISRQIWEADLIIADLSGRNPNVMYELGLTHAAKKPVVMLLEAGDSAPFDVAHIRYLSYSASRLKDLQSALERRIRSTVARSATEQPDFFPQLKLMTKELSDELSEYRSAARVLNLRVLPESADIFFNNRLVGRASTLIEVIPSTARNTLSASAVGFFEDHREIVREDLDKGEVVIELEKVFVPGTDVKQRLSRKVPAWLRDRRRDPQNPAITRAISSYLTLIGEREDAFQETSELLTIAPNWYLSYVQMGFFYGINGQIDEAMQYYKKSLDIRDDHYIAHFNLACCYCFRGELDMALEELDLIRRKPAALEAIRQTLECLRHDPDFRPLLDGGDYERRFSQIERDLFPEMGDPSNYEHNKYYTF